MEVNNKIIQGDAQTELKRLPDKFNRLCCHKSSPIGDCATMELSVNLVLKETLKNISRNSSQCLRRFGEFSR